VGEPHADVGAVAKDLTGEDRVVEHGAPPDPHRTGGSSMCPMHRTEDGHQLCSLPWRSIRSRPSWPSCGAGASRGPRRSCTSRSQEVSVLVRRGDATLGLRYGADPHPEMLATPIYDEPMMVVCSPRHRLARHRRVAPSALGAERWVAFPPRSDAFYDPYPWSLQNRLAAWGLSPAEIIPIDSLTAQKRMVEAG